MSSPLYIKISDKDNVAIAVNDTLTIPEVFYLATLGGGAFFGKVGSFEAGYEFDAFVLDDSRYDNPGEYDIAQRLERVIYLTEDSEVLHKFVAGRQLF